MASQDSPSYDLAAVQQLVRTGAFFITAVALTGAGEMKLDRTDIECCVLALTPADFRKTMPADKVPGLMQDVYKPRYQGKKIYVKLQVRLGGSPAVVVSFKRK